MKKDISITKSEKKALRKFYDANYTSTQQALECTVIELSNYQFKRSDCKTESELKSIDCEIERLNLLISRYLGQLDILNIVNFCSV